MRGSLVDAVGDSGRLGEGHEPAVHEHDVLRRADRAHVVGRERTRGVGARERRAGEAGADRLRAQHLVRRERCGGAPQQRQLTELRHERRVGVLRQVRAVRRRVLVALLFGVVLRPHARGIRKRLAPHDVGNVLADADGAEAGGVTHRGIAGGPGSAGNARECDDGENEQREPQRTTQRGHSASGGGSRQSGGREAAAYGSTRRKTRCIGTRGPASRPGEQPHDRGGSASGQ